MAGDIESLRAYRERNDGRAFVQLVGRYAGLVYGASFRITGNAQDAEDITQEVFLKLADGRNGVPRSLPAWLHTVAVHLSLDRVRVGERRRRHEEAAAAARPEAAGDAPAWRELAPHLDAALAKLPEDLRDLLVRHFLQGHSQVEIAAPLGVNQSTVSRHVDKGVRLLREALKRAGIVVPAAFLATLLSANAASAAPTAVVATLCKLALTGTAAGASAGAGTATSAAASTSTAASTMTGGISIMKLGLIGGSVAVAVITAAVVTHVGGQESATSLPTSQRAQAILQPEEPTFGPVIQRVVKEGFFVDLDSGEVCPMSEDFLKAGPQSQLAWMRERGVDAHAEVETAFRGLAGIDMLAKAAPEGAWETLRATEVVESLPVTDALPPAPVWMSATGSASDTYLFRTCEGGRGVLQILGFENGPKGVTIRYKLIERSEASAEGERHVFLPDADRCPMMLDLDTGHLFHIPEMDGKSSEQDLLRAISALGRGDLAYDRALTCLRGAAAGGNPIPTSAERESVYVYEIPKTLPAEVAVTTAEGRRYRVTILSADNKGCELSYREEGGAEAAEAHEKSVRKSNAAGSEPVVEPVRVLPVPSVPEKPLLTTTQTVRGVTIYATAHPKRLAFCVAGAIKPGESIPLLPPLDEAEQLTEEETGARTDAIQLLAASGSFVRPRDVEVVGRSVGGKLRVRFMFDGSEDPGRRIRLQVTLTGIGGTVLKNMSIICSDKRLAARENTNQFSRVPIRLSRENSETIEFNSSLKVLIRGIEVVFEEAEHVAPQTMEPLSQPSTSPTGRTRPRR